MTTSSSNTELPDEPQFRLDRRYPNKIVLSAAALGIALFSVWLFVAFTHIGDATYLEPVDGFWFGLADWANQGILYPALYDRGYYGGTRYLGLPILALAWFERFLGDFIVAGKLLNLIQAIALIAVLVHALVRRGCTRPEAIMISGCTIAVIPVWMTALNVHNDALPVALQVSALTWVYGSDRTRDWIIAAVLCALAAVWKLSAVWAGVALAAWLLLYRRPLLWRFCLSGLTVYAVAMLSYEVASQGRFTENILGLAFAGVNSEGTLLDSLTQGVLNVKDTFLESALILTLLSPFAIVGLLISWQRGKWNVDHFAFIACAAVTIVVYSDVGVAENNFIAVSTMLTLLIGHAWVLTQTVFDRRVTSTILAPLFAASIALSLVFQILGSDVIDEIDVAYNQFRTGDVSETANPRPLADHIEFGSALLAENPYHAISMNTRPVVLDPFMLLRMDRARPEIVDLLIERLDAQEFDYLVLLMQISDPVGKDWWYAQYHFGPRVTAAMQRNYRHEKTLPNGYELYRRR